MAEARGFPAVPLSATEPGTTPPGPPLPWDAPTLPEGPIDPGAATPSPPPPAGATPTALLLPRGVGEVIDTAIGVYRRNWKLLVGTAAIVIVPIQLFNAFLNRGAAAQFSDIFRSLQNGVTPTTSTGSGAGFLGEFLALLSLPFFTAALATAAASCYMGDPITPGEAWRRTGRRFGAVLGLGLLRFLLIGASLFFFAVPGIYLYVKLLLAPVALMVEGAGPIGAMERSWHLTKGLWWRVCGVQVLKVVLAWFGLVLFQSLALGLSLITGPVGWLFLAIGGSIAELLVYPFVVSVTVVTYFDLRIRKEGFDLAVTAQQLQAPRAA